MIKINVDSYTNLLIKKKNFLLASVVFYYFGDLITTGIGLRLGINELNIIGFNIIGKQFSFEQMIFIKTMIIFTVILAIRYFEKSLVENRHRASKSIAIYGLTTLYLIMILFGFLAVLNNIINILIRIVKIN